ncbi:Autophagy-related protein 13 [Lasallia pustulata]|uniref:Autophagy-related protein 13 n=1 Tax=Lasallia pustulata TaxID=136370 RepID=A0A1W5CSH3_9LECA|nr:Autophagy-related protein 13 [Lasallia pustulata]
MHQHPRAPPVTASPASSPRTNPSRTNNPRDREPGGSVSGSERGTPSEQCIGIGEGADALLRGQESSGQAKDTVAKLSQVVQNYYTKAALIIVQSRVSLPPAYVRGTDNKRVNKWFNVELDETDVLRDDVRTWKVCDVTENRPPPMIIETFLDTEDLTHNQSLVIIDDHGKRWDVEEVLGIAADASRGRTRTSRPQVVLERWRIELGEIPNDLPKDLASLLPRLYKNSIVLFRSLFTYAKLLPAWQFSKKLAKPRSSHSPLKLKYRIAEGSQTGSPSGLDTLTMPLFQGGGRVVEKFAFEPIESPAGSFSIQVSYRTSCDFRIDDSEALLSSHFMGMDDHYFEPSLGHEDRKTQHKANYSTRGVEAGSLPPQRKEVADPSEQGQAYGSLSTFHQAGRPAGSSPLSALRAARELSTPSPADSSPQKPPTSQRSAQGSRSSLRSVEGGPSIGRRTSVSFVPFKAPSLSASPAQAESLLTSSPRGSLGRTSTLSALAEARNRDALGLQSKPPSRGSPTSQENAFIPSVSTSPKPPPLSRYSSSFGHRRARHSAGGGSKTDDDNSSGKTSITSSAAQPGSGILAEGGGGSSGSLQTDDDNISDFLKMLDQKKDLKSFQHSNDSAAANASTRRTTAALSKFQRMRDSNAALSDSMSSSLLLHRSSSSSSRQLSAVPPMVSGASMSISSSPGKPISPHTPHTPAIPSRLSANSIIEYPQRNRGDDRHRLSREEEDQALPEDDATRDAGTGAIDIPTSPRPFHPNYRRSSSVAQQPRTMVIDDDIGEIFPFGLRSASLGGADERPPLSLSALLGLQEGSDVAIPSVGNRPQGERRYRPAPQGGDGRAESTTQQSSSPDSREAGSQQIRGTLYRPRIGRVGTVRGQTSPHGSLNTSLAGGDLRTSAGSGSSDQKGGRYSGTRPTSTCEEDEPLLFAMSDFGAVQQSRRSVEEARGGGESGPSSRRGSRRGGPGPSWT